MSKRIIAWDSCIIVDAIQKHSQKYAAIQPMILNAEKGDLKIVVSSLSAAEVKYLRELSANGMSQTEQDDLIDRWFNNDYIEMRNADFGTCKYAADIGRIHANLSPTDAVILATTIRSESPMLITYDNGKTGKFDGLLSLDGRVGNPAIKICKPEDYANQIEMVYGE